MKNTIKKPYGNIYFEKEIPDGCRGCPFNYDTIRCEALEYDYRDEELTKCLDGDAITRYSKCPLKLTAEKDAEIELLKNVLDNLKGEKASDTLVNAVNAVYEPLLEQMVKNARHQVCEEIRKFIHTNKFMDWWSEDFIDVKKFMDKLDQIEKGESDEKIKK